MKKMIVGVVVCLLSMQAFSEDWNLTRQLMVSPSGDMDVTFQVIEGFDPDEKLLVGWVGEDMDYAFVVDEQPGGQKEGKHWKGIEKELMSSADSKKLEVLNEGQYTTDLGLPVNYKIYSWLDGGEEYTQVFHLLKTEKVAYWVVVNPLDNARLMSILDDSIKILKTAEIL